MPDPSHPPHPLRRLLEGFNLLAAIFCVSVGVYGWLTSPRPAGGHFPGVLVIAMFTVPLLLATSLLLMFVNGKRAAIGFAATALAVFALSRCQVLLH